MFCFFSSMRRIKLALHSKADAKPALRQLLSVYRIKILENRWAAGFHHSASEMFSGV